MRGSCTSNIWEWLKIAQSLDEFMAELRARIDSAAWSNDAAQSDEVLQDRANALLLVAAPELLAANMNAAC